MIVDPLDPANNVGRSCFGFHTSRSCSTRRTPLRAFEARAAAASAAPAAADGGRGADVASASAAAPPRGGDRARLALPRDAPLRRRAHVTQTWCPPAAAGGGAAASGASAAPLATDAGEPAEARRGGAREHGARGLDAASLAELGVAAARRPGERADRADR